MQISPESYSRSYLVQALFRLMEEHEYGEISVSDICRKAGVGRATFYRYFKRKKDVLVYYFDRNAEEFRLSQRYYPRCREDYILLVSDILKRFKANMTPLRLIRRAHLEYLYLDYLNGTFLAMFAEEFPDKHRYLPYLYAGMLFNFSMAWLDDGCPGEIAEMAGLFVDAIYFRD